MAPTRAQWLCWVIGIKGHLIPITAKLLAAIKPCMVAVTVTGVFINPHCIAIIIRLENAMMFDNPCHFGVNIGANDCGDELGMVERCQLITKIMNQCANN